MDLADILDCELVGIRPAEPDQTKVGQDVSLAERMRRRHERRPAAPEEPLPRQRNGHATYDLKFTFGACFASGGAWK